MQLLKEGQKTQALASKTVTNPSKNLEKINISGWKIMVQKIAPGYSNALLDVLCTS